MQNIRGTAGTALLVLGLATALCLMRSSHLDGCQGGLQGGPVQYCIEWLQGATPLACMRASSQAADSGPRQKSY